MKVELLEEILRSVKVQLKAECKRPKIGATVAEAPISTLRTSTKVRLGAQQDHKWLILSAASAIIRLD